MFTLTNCGSVVPSCLQEELPAAKNSYRNNDRALPKRTHYGRLPEHVPNADEQLLPETDLRGRFLENIQPLLTIANNNGFEYMRKL
ncbi:hypothetical protein OQX63_14710 [Pedobacter sp. PF22-3]|uniref:hypothetical protein n=1 Tax=Pedobacter sp. PF22-3 TaxID=2994467 RepID=UPI002245D5E3|nr:hypothetical protein [Pedobacter sp. PF22-3]MCX2494736.1 hypothetical protein [Pedobacter sp. PF22-3]